jgi:cytochrome c
MLSCLRLVLAFPVALGMTLTGASLASAQTTGASPAASPARGGVVFRSRCSACHAVTAGTKKIGPSLFGVVGRRAGSAPAFPYSPALKKSALIWSQATLDRYLTDPKATVPMTSMAVKLPDAKQRNDLIAYLGTLK